MSLQDKIFTLEKVLNVVLKIAEFIVTITSTILDKIDEVSE